MIRVVGPSANQREVFFAEPPWTNESWQWQAIDEELARDDAARLLVSAVEKRLDLQPLWASYSPGGSDALRPDLMLKIVLMEVWSGRQHPSQWFKDTRKDTVLQWAGMGIRPSRSSWYNFRDRLGTQIDAWFRQVLHIARDAGITPARRGALDGTFVSANASRHHLLNEERLEKRQAELEQKCVQDTHGVCEEEVPAWMAKTPGTRLEQAKRYSRAKRRLDEFHAINQRQNPCRRRPRKKIVVSATDPDSALGWDKLKVFRPLYNVQLMRDVDSCMTLAYGVFAQNNDGGMLQPMVRRAREEMQLPLAELLCDASYATGCNLAICDHERLTLYSPWKENDYSQTTGKGNLKMIPKEQFSWLPEINEYRCPQGHPLKWIGKEKRTQTDGEVNVLHRYRCSPDHCRTCRIQPQCTKSIRLGRAVKRSEHEDLIMAHRSRMATDDAKDIYRLRKQTVELGNADLKRNRNLREFSGRGLIRATTETGLNELARNLIIVEQTLIHCERQPAQPENTSENTS